MKDQVIPKATARRLPLYYRYLRMLHDTGKNKVSSTELSEAVQVDSATIRRDFSYFGELGKRGYGYDVENLMNFFAKTLNEDELTNVFTAARLVAPPEVLIQNVDLTNELQTLIYFLHHDNELIDEEE